MTSPLSLPPALAPLLEQLSAHAIQQQTSLYLVGGIVRDWLLGRPNWDVDLVTEGDAIGLAKSLQQRYGGQLQTHPQFMTATWKLSPEVLARFGISQADFPITHLDFARARAETYDSPAHLPTVRPASIQEDLHRRDISINALALSLTPIGELLDVYQGQQDLQAGMIRVLHPNSFIDDPTRIFRAIRFEQRFGFQIDSATLGLIPPALPLLDTLSGERLRHELDLMFIEPAPLASLERMEALGLFPHIAPQLQIDSTIHSAFTALASLRTTPPWPLNPAFDWVALQFTLLTYHFSAEQTAALAHRLALTKSTQQAMLATQQGHRLVGQLADQSPSQIVRVWEGLGETAWLANWLLGDPIIQTTLAHLGREWQHRKPHLGGNDLRRLGLPAGPAMGQLLWDLRAAWLDGILDSEDAERRFAQQRIKTLHT